MSSTRTDRDLHDMREAPEREISLGTSTILGMFFALALVCAVFFGLGYTFGRKSVPPASAPIVETANSETFKTFKPAPGNPASSSPANTPSLAAQHPATITVPVPPAEVQPAALKKPFDADAEIVTSAAPVKPATTALKPGSPQPAAAGTAIVQVSAFRRQEDADMVASALRRKGYTVYIRQEPQDNYLHVQLGPYTTKKDAEAMRDRLSADGFNAIVK